MKRKIFLTVIAFVIISLLYLSYLLFGSTTQFKPEKKFLFIHPTENNLSSITQNLVHEEIISSPISFKLIASYFKLERKIKPGKYEIKKGQNLISIIKMLKNNKQSTIKLVINKIRTLPEFASLIDKNFGLDSTSVLNFIYNIDSLKTIGITDELLLDKRTFTTTIIPNTYEFYWNASMKKIITKLYNGYSDFWNEERKQKAQAKNLSINQVTTIASIVEEETNKNDEKETIASVYLNRLAIGMPLGADPTIKFAVNDFTLRRIYSNHLKTPSEYNTYLNKGLPPGPICTPSQQSIDAVLNAKKTKFIFFVARADFSGYHDFSETFKEHLKKAAIYQLKLNELNISK